MFYNWICIRYDEVGLFTADLKRDNETIKNIGGSYPSAFALKFDAKRTWGNLPIHWEGFIVQNEQSSNVRFE